MNGNTVFCYNLLYFVVFCMLYFVCLPPKNANTTVTSSKKWNAPENDTLLSSANTKIGVGSGTFARTVPTAVL